WGVTRPELTRVAARLDTSRSHALRSTGTAAAAFARCSTAARTLGSLSSRQPVTCADFRSYPARIAACMGLGSFTYSSTKRSRCLALRPAGLVLTARPLRSCRCFVVCFMDSLPLALYLVLHSSRLLKRAGTQRL